ncbi:inositol monophosphatase family protein [Haematospirillum jordaniae]|uniref:inositol monophosphatase family protein n=1 Tax=Haematospirillum jordaniae TaxID=1549855 RepID=UPI00143308BA|nr:inositol monophosphatase family protein [Haematospirillum jordaniae]NKD44230.1 inositol monophosphatase [Haematospirillum jordaniae]NKD83182.1 inositol monophosphatase [Haematospirillum jordaniae]NKD84675.1 inositol monophosphatase [Haematospirillum jordaniae]NKD91507.1 inositol monophosphatase [Haematospirillum jordaniae]
MALRSPVLNVMVMAAEKAGRKLVRDFGELEQLQVSIKGVGDFVSAADLKAEKILRAELSKARPSFGFLLEEGGVVEGSDTEHRWIIDPLDGTTNFLHGIPHFAVSIALERAGEVVAGVTYNPITNELFTAEKGGGAFFNDRRLRVSGRRKADEAVLGTGIPHKGRGEHPVFVRQLQRIMNTVAGVRRMGSASLDLAWVAAGRFDGFWEAHLSPWDVAAGVLMVREAGGYVSSLDTTADPVESGNLLASNEPLHHGLLALLKEPGSSGSDKS